MSVLVGVWVNDGVSVLVAVDVGVGVGFVGVLVGVAVGVRVAVRVAVREAVAVGRRGNRDAAARTRSDHRGAARIEHVGLSHACEVIFAHWRARQNVHRKPVQSRSVGYR